MNNIIREILDKSYQIVEQDNQWIFTNEEGEEVLLMGDELQNYVDHIVENIESFGYNQSDLSDLEDVMFDDDSNTMSPKELKLLKKQEKKEAKFAKKQEKKDAKIAKKEAKIAKKEAKLTGENFSNDEWNEQEAEQEEVIFHDEPIVEAQTESYQEHPIEEQPVAQVMNNQNQQYDANAYLTNQQYNNQTQDQQGNYNNNYDMSINQTQGKDYSQNNMYYGYNQQMPPGVQNNYDNQKIRPMNLEEMANENHDEITKSIISNISATHTSVLFLRKLLEEVKEI